MLYIILIIILIFLYLIYKGQNPTIRSKADVAKCVQEEIAQKEEALLNHIETNHLKDYMQIETALFECGRKNFIRLNERFKHDDIKLEQIIKDWIDHMQMLNDAVFESLMLDTCTSEDSEIHYDTRDELYIKIQEINKRFKDLLGKEYVDPEKFIKSYDERVEELIEKTQQAAKIEKTSNEIK